MDILIRPDRETGANTKALQVKEADHLAPSSSLGDHLLEWGQEFHGWSSTLETFWLCGMREGAFQVEVIAKIHASRWSCRLGEWQ